MILDKYKSLNRQPVNKDSVEIAQLWYDNMLKESKINEDETEKSQLWYEVMRLGGI